ncbi:triose-phosphate isomerase [Robiginitomaculum antarcticum]|uniref:triose-phosphate isomerase n=1 Tax=Robiginitomaculum antarcticum TaxID=437507 RepID=UPI00036BA2F7|nr:triose-phosphate isomerase [Robiginitomaculum antarcticum]
MKKLVAANWKMNGEGSWSTKPAALASLLGDNMPENVQVLFCPPAVYLDRIATEAGKFGMNAGAQNCHASASGAFTGEISAQMAADCGADYVICGHSERRALFGETDAVVRAKADAVIAAGLSAIICVGETLAYRESGEAEATVEMQLKGSIPTTSTALNTVIAYEPVWAIGTGKTATLDDIEQMHGHIRKVYGQLLGDKSAGKLRIQYGGSVKPANAKEILSAKGVDGALVGGASLKMEDFAKIILAG